MMRNNRLLQKAEELGQEIMHRSTGPLSHGDTTRSDNSLFWKLMLFFAVFVMAYFSTFASFVRTWSGRDDYMHGFLIPFVSLYFVWIERERLKGLPVGPQIPAGLGLSCIGGAMLFAGSIAGVVMLQQISVIVIIPGLVLLILGARFMKALFLPLFYLVFMVPSVLDIFISPLHWPSQVFAAMVATKMLAIIGIPVFRHINFIDLPTITLEVANQCSGVRYLISIIAIGIPLAYFTQKTTTRKLLLVGLALAVGIIANPIRIALIGIWAYNGGEVVHGPLHVFQGFFVSMAGFAFLFLSAWVLSRRDSGKREESGVRESGSVQTKSWNSRKFDKALVIASCMLLVFGLPALLYTSKPVPLSMPLETLSNTLSVWNGRPADLVSETLRVPGADAELYRTYKNAAGQEVTLYIAYFEDQKQSKEMVYYTLKSLYAGNEAYSIPLQGSIILPVRGKLMKGGSSGMYVMYWYQMNGRVTADNYKAKLYTFLDSLMMRKSNGAVIMLSGRTSRPEEASVARNAAADFAKIIHPELLKILP